MCDRATRDAKANDARGVCDRSADVNEFWVWRLRVTANHGSTFDTVHRLKRSRSSGVTAHKKSHRDECGLLRVGRDHYSLKWASRGPRRARQKATRADAKTEPPPRAAVAGGRARVYDACVRRTSSRVTRGEAQPRVACALTRDKAPRGVYSLDASARRAKARLRGQEKY
jgi:hypothetical protein